MIASRLLPVGRSRLLHPSSVRLLSEARSLPVLPPLSEKPAEASSRLAGMWEKYSVTGQQKRLSLAESLFQAASVQAQDG
jgi:hypothetical protein